MNIDRFLCASARAKAAREISRAGFVACMLCMIVVPMALDFLPRLSQRPNPMPLSPETRVALTLVCLLAPALFVASQWVFQRAHAAQACRAAFIANSVLTEIVLFLPALIVVGRLQFPGLSLGVSILAFGSVLSLTGLVGEQVLNGALLHCRMVMWDSWERLGVNADGDCRSKLAAIQAFRNPCYVDELGIARFQQTLTCRMQDASVLSDRLAKSGLAAVADLDVLDIGGGDGVFTASVLKSLPRSFSIGRIEMVDPVDCGQRYRDELARRMNSLPQIVCRLGGRSVDELLGGKRYDLVIASHSLYGLMDSGSTPGLLHELRLGVKPGGWLVVILASECSRAYSLKRRSLVYLLGEAPEDAVAESNLLSQPAPDESVELESLMLLRSLMKMDQTWDEPQLRAWLSYFLRVPQGQIDDDRYQILQGIVEMYMQEFKTVPESVRRSVRSAGYSVDDSDQVLLHRSDMMIWHC